MDVLFLQPAQVLSHRAIKVLVAAVSLWRLCDRHSRAVSQVLHWSNVKYKRTTSVLKNTLGCRSSPDNPYPFFKQSFLKHTPCIIINYCTLAAIWRRVICKTFAFFTHTAYWLLRVFARWPYRTPTSKTNTCGSGPILCVHNFYSATSLKMSLPIVFWLFPFSPSHLPLTLTFAIR